MQQTADIFGPSTPILAPAGSITTRQLNAVSLFLSEIVTKCNGNKPIRQC